MLFIIGEVVIEATHCEALSPSHLKTHITKVNEKMKLITFNLIYKTFSVSCLVVPIKLNIAVFLLCYRGTKCLHYFVSSYSVSHVPGYVFCLSLSKSK